MRLDADHPALAGHFPGNPIVPGAFLLSMVIEYASDALARANDPRRIDGIRQAKFLRPLRPGHDFTFALATADGDVQRFRVLVDGETIASGSLSLADIS